MVQPSIAMGLAFALPSVIAFGGVVAPPVRRAGQASVAATAAGAATWLLLSSCIPARIPCDRALALNALWSCGYVGLMAALLVGLIALRVQRRQTTSRGRGVALLALAVILIVEAGTSFAATTLALRWSWWCL